MRIVSLLAGATEIICALGAEDQLVGRSHACDHPSWVHQLPSCTRPGFDPEMPCGQIDAEVRRRLKEKLPLFHIDTERIAALAPDLLIAQAHCEVCAVTPGDVQRAGCRPLSVPVLALSAGSLEGVYGDIQRIARAIGRADAGQALVNQMQTRAAFIRQQVRPRHAPTLVMLEWTDPLYAMGNWGPELVDIAGGKLLLGDKGQHSRAVSWEEVRAADPEFLVIAPCGFGLKRAQGETAVMQALPGWAELRAVREKKVVCADGNLYFNRAGTTVIASAEILADILHGTHLHLRPAMEVWAPFRLCDTESTTREQFRL